MIVGSVVAFLGLLMPGEADMYHTNRTFVAIETSVGAPTAYAIYTAGLLLTNELLVGPGPLYVVTNQTYGLIGERVALGYGSAAEAWGALSNSFTVAPLTNYGEIYTNAGWVKGTLHTNEGWNAYLWALQNQITFMSSTSLYWVSEDGKTNVIAKVFVGSIGDYGPTTLVTSVGPVSTTNAGHYLDDPGEGQSQDAIIGVDTNVYYAVLKVDLKEVSFSGTKYHTVKKDDGSQDYTAPHWQDNSSPLDGDADDAGDKKYPVCFTRNTKMKVTAKWRIEPANPGVTIKVKGDGPGNLDFPDTTAAISGNDVTITDVECSNPFANEVDFFDPMSITWSFSMDGGSTWCNAGTSANQTYVTLGDPLTTVYHTLAHLGCKNADGENTAANCTAKIWTEFTDRDVRRVDGVQLTYYASYTCGNVTTASLLANGDGQCGSWASLFIDMRKVQGIDDTDEYVIFRPIPPSGIPQDYVGFLVKNWTFPGSGSSGHATHPYLNLPDSPFIGATSYNWMFAEVTDATGIPGQGNANPASFFNNHQVVISGEYYDPSYGVKHNSLQDIDDNSIDGYYIGPVAYPVDEPVVDLDLNGDGDKTDLQVDTGVYLIQKNAAGLDIWEQRYNW